MVKKQKEPNKTLFIIGVIMIIIGAVLLVSSVLGTLQQAYVGVETPIASVEVGGISPTSATMIASGAILVILGMIVISKAFKFGK